MPRLEGHWAVNGPDLEAGWTSADIEMQVLGRSPGAIAPPCSEKQVGCSGDDQWRRGMLEAFDESSGLPRVDAMAESSRRERGPPFLGRGGAGRSRSRYFAGQTNPPTEGNR
ncbi:hypothetical protein SSP35_14_00730 [Streptomyces sp. NBRC 110611]|nr:hypothetical protein SSP35_14_00730 [Streptomyces sp. NBRC 110611]